VNRSKRIEKILDILQSQAETTISLLDIFVSGYSSSYKKARQGLSRNQRYFKTDWADRFRNRQQFYSTLNRLKNQGLIERKPDKGQTIWKITEKGKGIFNDYKKDALFSGQSCDYEIKGEKNIKIIIFDIPEKERRKREWLRSVLNHLKFSLLQKSVWIGKNQIPEGLLKDLRKRDMLNYVHIFAISRSGTILRLISE